MKNYRPGEFLAPFGQEGRRSQDHCHMGVVAATVHPAWIAGGELLAGIFLEGQGVHIGPQGDAGAFPGPGQDTNHPGTADAAPDLQPQFA